MRRSYLLFCICSILLLPSCISKKKHLEEIDSLQARHRVEVDSLARVLGQARADIYQLRLQLAEENGENNALVAMQDKLQTRIDALEAEIERLSQRSQSQRMSLDNALQAKEAELEAQKALLNEVRLLIRNWEQSLSELVAELRDSLYPFDPLSYELEAKEGMASLILSEDVMFVRHSATRIPDQGEKALAIISEVLVKHPNMELIVIVHTDNTPPKNRSYKDNWYFSTLRAASVVRSLTKEYGISPSRVLAAGQGEFQPRASNATEEGRAKNRRVEWQIIPREGALARDLRRLLQATQP